MISVLCALHETYPSRAKHWTIQYFFCCGDNRLRSEGSFAESFFAGRFSSDYQFDYDHNQLLPTAQDWVSSFFEMRPASRARNTQTNSAFLFSKHRLRAREATPYPRQRGTVAYRLRQPEAPRASSASAVWQVVFRV